MPRPTETRRAAAAGKPPGPWAALNKILDALLARTRTLEAATPKVGDLTALGLTADDLHRLQARRLTIGGQTMTVLVLKE